MAGDKDDGVPPPPGKGAEVRGFKAAGRGRKCPICAAAVAIACRPFCSKRCADLDLGRWLRGTYRILAEEPPDGGGEIAPEDGEDLP